MNIFSSLTEASSQPEIRHIALGFFDGLHLGHKEVIAGNRSPEELARTAILSFENHPQTVLFRDQPIRLITGLPHKLAILTGWGIRNCVLLPFDLEISRKSPETFLRELQAGFPHLESIRVGENFRFGHQRLGDPDLLCRWGLEHQIKIRVIPSLLDQGKSISSSRIRTQLNAGNFKETAELLGRPYSLYGKVVEGQKLGRQLGFPTANLDTEDGQLLPLGVYVGYVELNQLRYRAAINIGRRPTVATEKSVWVEAHLPGYSGNLYGETIDLVFSTFIRKEKKFPNPEALKEQIALDVEQVKNSLL